ncbi:MAG TPA: MBL fold metallo-hydrolase RNA specificity domain-containing protein [Candidatus Nanoarchaeia archaeon]|nr:MBL fold metallo-hydrolase RNA specificity domain-containing protein [Candidatus Nanoarchaeia archaeon]
MDIIGVGGYGEVGRNMTFAQVGQEAAIFDIGFNIQKLSDFEETGGDRKLATKQHLIKAEAVADDTVLASYKNNVKGILVSHCHLDHCGAIPFMANEYKAPIVGTPFTMEVINNLLRDDNIKIKNKLHRINNGTTLKISDNLELEFINITHSTPSTSLIALHTKEGIILYANDFKLDNHPILGQKPDYKRIKELGDSGKVRAVVLDACYSNTPGKTPSEKVAREMLKEVMLEEDLQGRALVISCTASHMARIKSIQEFSHKIGRELVVAGRSFLKYISAAEAMGISHYTKGTQIWGHRAEIAKNFKKIAKNGLDKYVVLATGGQGEPHSVLGRMTTGELPFAFQRDDAIIFSNKVIPTEINIRNRAQMEKKLVDNKLRLFKDVHSSGHCYREDLREFIKLCNPEHIIPCQGEPKMLEGLKSLGMDMGYNAKRLHVLQNGQKITI